MNQQTQLGLLCCTILQILFSEEYNIYTFKSSIQDKKETYELSIYEMELK